MHAPRTHARHLKGLHSPPKVAKATTSRPTTGLPTTAFSLLDIFSGCLQQLSDTSLTSASHDAHEQGVDLWGPVKPYNMPLRVYTYMCWRMVANPLRGLFRKYTNVLQAKKVFFVYVGAGAEHNHAILIYLL